MRRSFAISSAVVAAAATAVTIGATQAQGTAYTFAFKVEY
jgi:hypothetical protein